MRRILILTLLLAFFVPVATLAAYGDTSKAVSEVYYGDGKDKLKAYFDFPEDIAVDSNGNFFIADTYNNTIRKINTSTGKVSTIWGKKSYGAGDKQLGQPKGLDVDSSGNIYVADTDNNRVVKVSGSNGTILAEGFNAPEDVVYHDGVVYVLDTGNNALKKISSSGKVSTINSSLNNPKKMVIVGNYAYVANDGTHQIKKVKLEGGYTTTFAGSGDEGYKNGGCDEAEFRNIWGIIYVSEEESFYVVDGNGYDDYIRKIDKNTCEVTLFASDANMVSINYPTNLIEHDGYLYVINSGIGTIHKFNTQDSNDNESWAGKERFQNKNGKSGLLGRPWDMTLDSKNRIIYFTENNKVKKYNLLTKRVSYVAGSSVDNYKDASAEKARFSNPTGITKKGNFLYIADRWNNRIRRVNVNNQVAVTISGVGEYNTTGSDDNGYKEGDADEAKFNHPGDIVSDGGKFLYVTDTGNNVIRRVNRKTGVTKLVAGSGDAGFVDGTKKGASFNRPFGIDISANGKFLYVADTNNHALRKVRISDGETTTITGTGSSGYEEGLLDEAVLSYPEYLHFKDKKIYFSETGSHRIRLVDMDSGVTKLIAGNGERGYKNGSADVAEFNNPKGLLLNKKKMKLFVADSYNDVFRKIDVKGEAPYADPAPVVSKMQPKSLKYSDYPSGTAMVEISGSEFRHGAKAYLGSYELTTYVQSDTSLAVEVPIGDMAAGYYELKVMNSDGQYDKLLRAFSAQEYSGNIPETDYWTN